MVENIQKQCEPYLTYKRTIEPYLKYKIFLIDIESGI